MATPILTDSQLEDVREKLKRAYESIGNLNTEITTFLETTGDNTFTREDEKAGKDWAEWAREHSERGVPIRFAVIAGEIVHHLRSCLDHIAWMLSSSAYQASNERDIGFPILTVNNKKAQTGFQRKVQGISSSDALKIIESLQPYHSGNPEDDSLGIVNELDRIDKHHNLVLVRPALNSDMRFEFLPSDFLGDIELSDDAFIAKYEDKVHVQFSRQVAFAEFGKRKNQPVIPGLTQLADAIRDVINMFG